MEGLAEEAEAAAILVSLKRKRAQSQNATEDDPEKRARVNQEQATPLAQPLPDSSLCPPETFLDHIKTPNQWHIFSILKEIISVGDSIHDSIIENNEDERNTVRYGLPSQQDARIFRAIADEDKLVERVSPGLRTLLRNNLGQEKGWKGKEETFTVKLTPEKISATNYPKPETQRNYKVFKICISDRTKGQEQEDKNYTSSISIGDLHSFFRGILGKRPFGIIYDTTNLSIEDILEASRKSPLSADKSIIPFYYTREVFYDPASKFNLVHRDKFIQFDSGQGFDSFVEDPEQSKSIEYLPFAQLKEAKYMFYTKYRIIMNPIEFNHKTGDNSVTSIFFDGNNEIYRATERDAEKQQARKAFLGGVETKHEKGRNTAAAAAQSKRLGDEGQGLSCFQLKGRSWCRYDYNKEEKKGGKVESISSSDVCIGIPWSTDRPFLADSLLLGNCFFYVYIIDDRGYGAFMIPESLYQPVDPYAEEKKYIEKICKSFPKELEIESAAEGYKQLLEKYNESCEAKLKKIQTDIEASLSRLKSSFTKDNIINIISLYIYLYRFLTSNSKLDLAPYEKDFAVALELARECKAFSRMPSKNIDEAKLKQVSSLRTIHSLLLQYRDRKAGVVDTDVKNNYSEEIKYLVTLLYIPRESKSNPFDILYLSRLYCIFREIRRSKLDIFDKIYNVFANLPESVNKVRLGHLMFILDSIQQDSWSKQEEKEEKLRRDENLSTLQNIAAAKALRKTKVEKLKEEKKKAAAAERSRKKEEKKSLKAAMVKARKLKNDPSLRPMYNQLSAVNKIASRNGKRQKPVKRPKGGGDGFLYPSAPNTSTDEFFLEQQLNYEIGDLIEHTIPTAREVLNSDTEIPYCPNHAISIFFLYLSALFRYKSDTDSKEGFSQKDEKILRLKEFFLRILYIFQKRYRDLSTKHQYPAFKLHIEIYRFFIQYFKLMRNKETSYLGFYGLADEILREVFRYSFSRDFEFIPDDLVGCEVGDKVETLKIIETIYMNLSKKSSEELLSDKKMERSFERAQLFCSAVQEQLTTEWVARFLLNLPEDICDWTFLKEEDEDIKSIPFLYESLTESLPPSLKYEKTSNIENRSELQTRLQAYQLYTKEVAARKQKAEEAGVDYKEPGEDSELPPTVQKPPRPPPSNTNSGSSIEELNLDGSSASSASERGGENSDRESGRRPPLPTNENGDMPQSSPPSLSARAPSRPLMAEVAAAPPAVADPHATVPLENGQMNSDEGYELPPAPPPHESNILTQRPNGNSNSESYTVPKEYHIPFRITQYLHELSATDRARLPFIPLEESFYTSFFKEIGEKIRNYKVMKAESDPKYASISLNDELQDGIEKILNINPLFLDEVSLESILSKKSPESTSAFVPVARGAVPPAAAPPVGAVQFPAAGLQPVEEAKEDYDDELPAVGALRAVEEAVDEY